MADRLSDLEDRRLAALFAAEPIADNGFSARVTGRLRRRMWQRRLLLAAAVFAGLLVAFRPLVDLVTLTYRTLLQPTNGLLALPAQWIPSAHMTIAGALFFGLLVLGFSLLED